LEAEPETSSRASGVKEVHPLGVVAHACNLSYSGGRDREDQGSRPAQTKSCRDPVSTKQAGYGVIPTMWEALGRRIVLGKKQDPTLSEKETEKQKDWGHCSGGSACLISTRP
jgi:hypothetical protein